ncbi:hypothetical protein HQ403_02125 [Candidatus Kaiserbacteria bacterium]|nr:hypothetical protein [Candidatus Kaiserbacteria bacterium]
MSYTVLKRILVAIGVVYFSTSFFITHTATREISPFFTWQVFKIVPHKTQSSYSIRILAYQGNQLETPVLLDDAWDVYLSSKLYGPPQFQRLVEDLGRSMELSSTKELSETYREKLEESFLSGPVVYELVRYTFDVLEYADTGTVSSEEHIAVFNTEK